MRQVVFGLGAKYDEGNDPSVSINRHGVVLEVHKNEAGNDLYRRVGRVRGATIDWGANRRYEDSGRSPGCALNANGTAIEVHKNNGTTLFYRVGTVSGTDVIWGSSDDYDSGVTPDIALTDSGMAVEVHCTESPFSDALYYRVGPVQGKRIDFGSSHRYSSFGKDPKVAVNESGVVVAVHKGSSDVIRYRVGRLRGREIEFGKEQDVGPGQRAGVALFDDGSVVVVCHDDGRLRAWNGRVEGTNVAWSEPVIYDEGSKPTVAAAGNIAVEVHLSALDLRFSTALLTDRAGWMQDRMTTLGSRPLRKLVLPASHDAAMYQGGLIADYARTQNLTIYEQLSYGIRYFDLRPKWNGSHMVIDHGGVEGPSLAVVLADIAKFANEGRRELVILKLGHFAEIDSGLYTGKLVPQVTASLGSWMYTAPPEGKRLSDVTLGEYTARGPAMLVVVGDGLALDHPRPGFWYYRDSQSDQAAKVAAAALRVYDDYSDTKDADFMKNDQRRKFQEYDGFCRPASTPERPLTSDLFLLSWTLTPKKPPSPPPYTVAPYAREVNPLLGKFMADLQNPNGHGEIVNLLYVDYVQWSRVTDIAILQNGG